VLAAAHTHKREIGSDQQKCGASQMAAARRAGRTLPPAAQEILTKIVAQQGSWTDGEKKWSAINNATKR